MICGLSYLRVSMLTDTGSPPPKKHSTLTPLRNLPNL